MLLNLSEVGFADLGVFAQFFGRGGVDDGASFEDVAAGCYLQGHVGVLFDEEDGRSLLVDLLDGLEDALDEDGGEPHGRFVEEQEFRAAHEGAAYGEHLLLAAGHRAGFLLDAFAEAWEELEDAVHVFAHARVVVSVVGAHLQVLAHRHAAEDLAPLRALGDALGDHVVRREALYLLAGKHDLALPRRQDAVDGAQRGGLARAVGAYEGDHLPLLDGQGDAAQGLDVPVTAVNVVQL